MPGDELPHGGQARARTPRRPQRRSWITRVSALSFGMSGVDNAIAVKPVTATAAGRAGARALPPGLLLGTLGIIGFSFSLPATRLAVADLDPWVVAFGRATVAAALAALYLLATGAPRPSREQARSLAIVAAGVVVGFPLLTSLALEAQTAAHGAVVIAILPAATAVAAVGARTSARAAPSGSRRAPAWSPCSPSSSPRAWAACGRRPVPARRGRPVRDRLRRGRRAEPHARRPDDDLLGARALRPAQASVTALAVALTGLHAGATAWSASPTSPSSRCSWASSPGTPGWPAAEWRASARSSSPSRCSPWAGRGAARRARRGGHVLTALAVLACVAATQRAAEDHPRGRMAVSTNAVGKSYPPRTYAVGREKIREYAFAVGETNPLHLDVEAARAAGYATSSRRRCSPSSTARRRRPGALRPEVGIDFARMVHGGQEFSWGPLVVAGDEIETTVTVKDISERSGTGFYVFESVSTNQDGDTVCVGTWTNIVRGG